MKLDFDAGQEFNLIGMAAALGIGLLIGLERERRKNSSSQRAPAGIRTFTLAALLGALSFSLGTPAFVIAGVLLGVLAGLAYLRTAGGDPGLTTEVALIVTFLLGTLAMRNSALAVALGVVVTILLASRSRLHDFVLKSITAQELHDGLLLAAAALVILPLTPDRALGPYGVFNPRTLWTLAVLVMAINAAGYIALRATGPKFGLSFAGFAGGFISSSATIGAMGARARQDPKLARGAVSGAVLSSVATVVQMVIIVGATSLATLKAVALPLLLSGLTALAYGAWFAWHAAQVADDKTVSSGRAFDPRLALIFTATLALVMFIAAALSDWLGETGRLLAATVSGLADTHAPAFAMAALAASGKITADQTLIPILLAFTANACTKMAVAFATGGRIFALKVIPGVALMVVAAWAGVALNHLGLFDAVIQSSP
jgi:uncharacterized membrane protein (DUF4010 family)